MELHIDIGFGEVVVPGVSKIVYPLTLDFSSPELNSYTMENTIAEKFQVMVQLGIFNSRMKCFCDTLLLSCRHDFDGQVSALVILKTFENHRTAIPNKPTIF